MLKRVWWMVWTAAVAAGATGCGIRNAGEPCLTVGPVGDFLCAPGRCLCPSGRNCEQNNAADVAKTGSGVTGPVCAECWNDLDCLRTDPLDRPKCMPAIPVEQGGDGLPFCRHYADHGTCNSQSSFLCLPGKCHPDAGVCVDCLADGDCPSAKPKCDPGVSPDYLPFCRDNN